MRAMAELKNIECKEDKHIIVRNLSRIMDIRIVDVDVEKRTIDFLCATTLAFEQVRRELYRIGYPIRFWKLSGFDSNHSKTVVVPDMVWPSITYPIIG